jgi:hypothetical protein
MVQLTDQLVERLDLQARRTGMSRSALIREAITFYLEQRSEAEEVRRYVEGYRRQPPAQPDEWGDLEGAGDVHGHELAGRLDQEERSAGLSW